MLQGPSQEEISEALRLVRKVRAYRDACRRLDFEPPDEELAQVVLLEFVRWHNAKYKPGWFHVELCRKLEQFSRDVTAGKSPRLIIEAPPRHGKSEIVSRAFPVWHLARNPTHEVVVGSYSQTLANKMSRDARQRRDRSLTRMPQLARGVTDGVEEWRLAAGGCFTAVGAGSGITGSGAHVFIIDDPFKDRKEADSQLIRENRWDWYTEAAYTRLAPGGGILVMATRWHDDDLTGRLLKEQEQGGDAWEVVSYPAIATEDEAHRRQGEALHEARWPLSRLMQIKGVLSPRGWGALYQQSPQIEGGAIIDPAWTLNRYRFHPQDPSFPGETHPRWDEVFVSVDATFKDTKDSDTVSITVWGRKGARLYLLDRVCHQMGFTLTRQRIRDVVHKWRTGSSPFVILIEDKANGPAIVDTLREEFPGVVPFDPTPFGSKIARCELASTRWEAGDIWLPDPSIAPWISDYVQTMTQFPAVKYDDDVDGMSQLIAYLWARRARVDQGRAAADLEELMGLAGSLLGFG